MLTFIKNTLFLSMLVFCSLVQADIKSDLEEGLDVKTTVANAAELGEFPDEIVKALILNKVDPAKATKVVVEAFPSYIHATSITRAAITAAPFSAPKIVGAAIEAASEFENDITRVAVEAAPKQKSAIKQSADEALPSFVTLTKLAKQAKKEPAKTDRQIQANASVGLAGVVLATRGRVTAINARGETRVLIRRSKFFAKDVIKTGAGASAQLRFEDRAVMGLRENSALNIQDYRFGGKKDDTNKVVMELVSGGFRTISGTIGKSNKAAYRVSTPAATIGIRGTDYDVVIGPEGNISVAVWEGGVTIGNDLGVLNIGRDSLHIFASISAAKKPKGTKEVPKDLLVGSGSATSLSNEQKVELKAVLTEMDIEIGEDLLIFLDDLPPEDSDSDDTTAVDGKETDTDVEIETEFIPAVDSPN